MSAYEREVRDQLFDDLIARADEIEGARLEGAVSIHTDKQVKNWLMALRNAYYRERQCQSCGLVYEIGAASCPRGHALF